MAGWRGGGDGDGGGDGSGAGGSGGWDGYLTWINTKIPCWDARIPWHYENDVRAVWGTLLEKLWTVTTDDGVFEIWRFVDEARQFGFTWIEPKPLPGSEA